ncbi:(d)CMP kinase [Candidatus Hecatella orcuttiae]|uniref:(d)CMP kinase n=1 Tax=Candidatus Hecatella orcuttiae TaxID=1935119 RepID=UPI002867CAC3|nr:cytidylate kinase family protein [Candidatus Hecatella orcuttiae]
MERLSASKAVITISGLHGTGKSTYAEALSKDLGLRHVSAGRLFRRLAEEKGLSLRDLTFQAVKSRKIDSLVDAEIKKEAEKGGVVVDGLLSAWMAGENAWVKVYLYASDEARFKRIARRDGETVEQARKSTLERERVERARYKKFYGIDLEDLTVYDIVLNTELFPLKSSLKLLSSIIKEYLKFKLKEADGIVSAGSRKSMHQKNRKRSGKTMRGSGHHRQKLRPRNRT